MLTIELFEKEANQDGYEQAHAFAREQYASPRMNMHLYYRPSILLTATDNTGQIIGVIGINLGGVMNKMLALDQRTAPYLQQPDASDQSIFALAPGKINIAQTILCAAAALCAYAMGTRYLGVLAIPVSRKIMAYIGIEPLACPGELIGFGQPNLNLIDEAYQQEWQTWFARNHPTSLEVVDLAQACRPCIETLAKFDRKFLMSKKLLELIERLG